MYSLGAEDGQLIKECARACRLLLGSSSAIKTISPLIIKHLDLNVMMAVVTQTLSSCLGARNPSLDVSRCSKKGGNTKSSKRTPCKWLDQDRICPAQTLLKTFAVKPRCQPVVGWALKSNT